MHLKRLESFLMNVEVTFYLRKQMKLEKNFTKKEAIYNFLKDKEQKDSLTNREKRELKNIDRYLKNFKNYLDKFHKYQYNITYGLDYLFNELNEKDYYRPTKIKSAFDGTYVLYESKGDKDNKLALYKYFDIIKPYLKDMIDDYKSKVNGKYRYQCESILFLSQIQIKLVKRIQKAIM